MGGGLPQNLDNCFANVNGGEALGQTAMWLIPNSHSKKTAGTVYCQAQPSPSLAWLS